MGAWYVFPDTTHSTSRGCPAVLQRQQGRRDNPLAGRDKRRRTIRAWLHRRHEGVFRKVMRHVPSCHAVLVLVLHSVPLGRHLRGNAQQEDLLGAADRALLLSAVHDHVFCWINENGKIVCPNAIGTGRETE